MNTLFYEAVISLLLAAFYYGQVPLYITDFIVSSKILLQ